MVFDPRNVHCLAASSHHYKVQQFNLACSVYEISPLILQDATALVLFVGKGYFRYDDMAECAKYSMRLFIQEFHGYGPKFSYKSMVGNGFIYTWNLLLESLCASSVRHPSSLILKEAEIVPTPAKRDPREFSRTSIPSARKDLFIWLW